MAAGNLSLLSAFLNAASSPTRSAPRAFPPGDRMNMIAGGAGRG
jgi:hypothetical protein